MEYILPYTLNGTSFVIEEFIQFKIETLKLNWQNKETAKHSIILWRFIYDVSLGSIKVILMWRLYQIQPNHVILSHTTFDNGEYR